MIYRVNDPICAPPLCTFVDALPARKPNEKVWDNVSTWKRSDHVSRASLESKREF
jgi:hypothetical protein